MSRRLSIRARLYGIFGLAIAFMVASTVYVFLEVLTIKNISANTATLTLGANDTEHVAERVLKALIFISMIASVLAGWLAIVLKTKITAPLATITTALSELARGRFDIEVPEVRRGDEIGEMARAFEVFRRNAMALKAAHDAAEAAEQRAVALARHDTLTGLPNRRVLSEEIDRAIARASRGEAIYAILLIDLDRFKPVNDLHGHAVGDSVLCEVAERIKAVVRKNDTFARLGGDEFAIVSETGLGSEPSAEAAIRLANRVIAAVRERIVVRNIGIEVGATIGIAQCPADGTAAETLLHAADMAMYRAKGEERGTSRFFELSMDTELRARATLDADLRKAIMTGAIEPYFQPLIELASDRLLGFEVLARWNHPQNGFIPRAEELGLISHLTFALLRTACCEAKDWPADTILSVNISPLQLKDPLLPQKVSGVLTEIGFPARRLELEITENALVSDLATARTILTSFQDMGIKIALDDFGTGYSSMYHLRELRFDRIKVDRSFIQSMLKSPDNARVVAAILGLTRSLGLSTIAEGIEDAEIAVRLTESGCEVGQGFYFGRAMPAPDATALAQQRAGLARAKPSAAG